ncbi:MAG: phosphatase PAP2 family protein [Candidatus Aminicenantales bacterium]
MDAERRFYIKASLVVYLAYAVLFEALGFYAVTLPTRDLSLPLDRSLPVIPAFIWPYLLCYVFPFLPFFVIKDWHRFNRAVLALVLAVAAAFVVYLALPIAFPHPDLGTGLSDRVLAFQFRTDFYPGANKLPSLHVTFAWLVWLVCLKQGLGRWREIAILAVAVMISISTLFVRQHILVDVLVGTAWAFAAWWTAGRLYPRFSGSGAGPPEAFRRMARMAGPFILLFTALLIFGFDLHYRRILP